MWSRPTSHPGAPKGTVRTHVHLKPCSHCCYLLLTSAGSFLPAVLGHGGAGCRASVPEESRQRQEGARDGAAHVPPGGEPRHPCKAPPFSTHFFPFALFQSTFPSPVRGVILHLVRTNRDDSSPLQETPDIFSLPSRTSLESGQKLNSRFKWLLQPGCRRGQQQRVTAETGTGSWNG